MDALVLLVADDGDGARATVRALRGAGMRVTRVASAAAALPFVAGQPTGCVVLDPAPCRR